MYQELKVGLLPTKEKNEWKRTESKSNRSSSRNKRMMEFVRNNSRWSNDVFNSLLSYFVNAVCNFAQYNKFVYPILVFVC